MAVDGKQNRDCGRGASLKWNGARDSGGLGRVDKGIGASGRLDCARKEAKPVPREDEGAPAVAGVFREL